MATTSRALFLVQRNDETAVGRATLRGAVEEAHRLQDAEPRALVTIADTQDASLVLGWWTLTFPDGPVGDGIRCLRCGRDKDGSWSHTGSECQPARDLDDEGSFGGDAEARSFADGPFTGSFPVGRITR